MYRQGHVIVGQHPGKFHGNVRKLNYRLLQTDHLPFQSCFFLKKGPAMIRLETKARRGRSCVFIIRNLVQLSTWKTENPTWTPPVASFGYKPSRSGAGSGIVERTAAAKCGAYSKHLTCNKEAFRDPSRSNVKLGSPIVLHRPGRRKAGQIGQPLLGADRFVYNMPFVYAGPVLLPIWQRLPGNF